MKNLDQRNKIIEYSLKLGKPKILSFEEMKKVLDKAKNYKKG